LALDLTTLDIVWFPPCIRHWIYAFAFDVTHIMRNAHLAKKLKLYCPSNLSSILSLVGNGGKVYRA
jgi:hypothetical protein